MNGPWVQTASGKAFSLINPRPEDVDFKRDVAEPLARQARFSGHVESGPYSVAQHCLEGADTLLRETTNRRLAALFLLHDAHEAYIGDIPTPVKAALEWHAAAAQLAGGGILRTSLKALVAPIDAALHAAAGLAPPSAEEAAILKMMDFRMLITERNHLLGPPPAPWVEEAERAQPIRRAGRLRVLPWPDAADAFMARAMRLFPALAKTGRRAA